MRNLVFAALLSMLYGAPVVAQEKCASVADCAQKAMEAAYQAKVALQLAVPKGAVLPFNLETCPEGWTTFPGLNGRVIVGAGQGDGLTMRGLGQVGGGETHTLAREEMPTHRHGINHAEMTRGGWGGQATRDVAVGGSEAVSGLDPSISIAPTGGGRPHNNMQPFYVLTYCERQ